MQLIVCQRGEEYSVLMDVENEAELLYFKMYRAPSKEKHHQLIFCQRVSFLSFLHMDKFGCIFWFNCLIHTHSVQEWFCIHSLLILTKWFCFYPSLCDAKNCFLNKIVLAPQLFFFIFSWTSVCSKCKTEDTVVNNMHFSCFQWNYVQNRNMLRVHQFLLKK